LNPVSLALLAGIGFLIFFWLKSLTPRKRVKAIILIALVLFALFTLLMAITGRLHWIAAVVAGLLPFAQKFLPIMIKALPFLGRWYLRRQQQKNANPQHSEINTAIFDMHVDQSSGVIYGTVKRGPFKGRSLNELSEKEFIELLIFCRQMEKDSAKLLENYLDRRFGDAWRKDDPGNGSSITPSGSMSKKEAYEILGLTPGCSKQEIIDAHRKLIQKIHPDRGGNDYLAAKINQAKDILLND
jgi:hypothetical protein